MLVYLAAGYMALVDCGCAEKGLKNILVELQSVESKAGNSRENHLQINSGQDTFKNLSLSYDGWSMCFVLLHSLLSTLVGTVTKKKVAGQLHIYPYDRRLFHPGVSCPTCQLVKPARSKHCSEYYVIHTCCTSSLLALGLIIK